MELPFGPMANVMTDVRIRHLAAVAAMIGVLASTATAQPPQGGRGGRGPGLEGRGAGPLERRLPPRDTASVDLPTGTASISGTVVVLGTGQPARRARVTLNAAEGGGSRSTLTDENGRYAFSGIVAGRYNLSASKTGHVGVSYGQTRPGRPGTPIQLADAQSFSANLQLPRGSVITGTVLDEYGEPTPGTQVRVMRYVMQAGRLRPQQSGTGTTDDRGVYRVYGLQPGDYVVSAIPRNSGPNVDVDRLSEQLQAVRERMAAGAVDQTLARQLATRASLLQSALPAQEEHTTGYAPVYYPGSISPADAAVVALGVGEERVAVDFQLQRVPMVRIEGSVVNATGQPVQNIQLTLTNLATTIPGIGAITARADGEGRFRMANVPPGQYRLIARANAGSPQRAPEPDGPVAGRIAGRGNQASIRLWGSLDVPVDGQHLSNVIVTLQRGLTMSGRITFEGTSLEPPADLSRLRVSLVPAEPGGPGTLVQSASGIVDASGRFTFPSVVPGAYRLTAAGAGTGWSIASSVVDGQDSLDFPIDVKPGGAITSAMITFTDKQSQLSGVIVNQQNRPAPQFTLILYSADERYWGPESRRIRSARPATDGQFTFSGVPPGDYKLVAITDAEPGAWFDPAFLHQMEGAAIALRIGEGEQKIQNIQIAQ